MAFVHPYGIIGFASHIEFTGSLIFCQDVDLDVLDFQLFGVEYIVVFSIHDLFLLEQYCDSKAYDYICFVLL
jgi:hypothetical protein